MVLHSIPLPKASVFIFEKQNMDTLFIESITTTVLYTIYISDRFLNNCKMVEFLVFIVVNIFMINGNSFYM